MKSSSNLDILVVLAKAGQQKRLMQHLENGFGTVRALHDPSLEDLRLALTENSPKVLLCELGSSTTTVREASKLISRLNLSSRMIVAAPSVSTQAVVKAMGQGARDLVSVEDPLHLQLVIARELGTLPAWCEQNAKRLEPFISEEQAQATLDGFRIVDCNQSFADLLGASSSKALQNAALLQYVDGDCHFALKQLINRCIQGERVADPLPVSVVRPDGASYKLLFSVKAAYQDDQVSVMLTARAGKRSGDTAVDEGSTQPPKLIDPAVTKRLQAALKQSQLSLVIQPISELVGQSQRVSGAMLDIYVKLKDAIGELPASSFIREARASGLIRYVDRWVMHNACALLRSEIRKPGSMLLFLRLSRQSLHDPTLVHTLKREVVDHGISADGIAFELSEPDVVDLTEHELKVLREIREAGFLLSISRFGSSPESRDLLSRLPAVDFIKLDPKLAMQAQNSDKTRLFIRALVEAANASGRGVVSTQVPNAASMATLWTLGVHYVQGNYLHEPVTVTKLD